MSDATTEAEQDPTARYAGQEPNNVTFAHMWDLFFGPEIARRQAAGTLPANFHIWMGQVLFPPKGKGTNRVLLNDEVKGMALMRAQREIQAGEPVMVDDLAHIEKFDLPDELLDHGHFTIIRIAGDQWAMHFNFFYGRAKAKDMLLLASQFMEASRQSAAKSHAGPSVDTLFSATELVSKAELILHSNPAVDSKSHGAVKSAINAWGRLGNIDAAFVALYNRLGQQRPGARYGDAQSRHAAPSAEEFELVAAVIERGLNRVAKATDR